MYIITLQFMSSRLDPSSSSNVLSVFLGACFPAISCLATALGDLGSIVPTLSTVRRSWIKWEVTHSLSRDTGSHEKISEPKNAPMKMQMMMYPLKYIASSMMMYATANWSMCKSARITCSIGEGR